MTARREFLKGVAALPLAGAVGGSVLFYSTPARAWVPVALAVAQAGFQLYQMSQSGGGGIGKLLAAQVEMLRAINVQLREIGQTVNQIYAGVEELKDLVEALPLQVTRQIYRSEVQAVSEFGSRLLDNGLINTQNRGIANAVLLDNGASQQALDRLGPAVNAVISDPSVLNVPLMCLAWYTEYQLLTRYVPFNPGRILTTATLYESYFERHAAQLKLDLSALDVDVVKLAQKLDSSPTFESADCLEGWYTNAGVGSPLSLYNGGTFVKYNPGTEPLGDGLDYFIVAAGELKAVGINIPERLSSRVPIWSFSSTPERRSLYGTTRQEWRDWMARVNRTPACVAGRSTQVAHYYQMQDEVKRTAENLRVRAIVNNHLYLAASEALASCQTIRQRTASLQA